MLGNSLHTLSFKIVSVKKDQALVPDPSSVKKELPCKEALFSQLRFTSSNFVNVGLIPN